jgi:hypothetical protein
MNHNYLNKQTMKKGKSILFFACFLLGSIFVKAQTADEIISKHLAAIGGKEKITQIKSLYMEGSMQVMGNETPTTTTILNGKGYRSESEFNGQKFVQVVSDKGGWMINPMMGADAQAIPDEQYKAAKSQIYVGAPFLNYVANGTKVELEGKDGTNFKLKVTTSDGSESTVFIDPTTFYITKMIRKGNMQGQDVEITTTFSDYQKTDFGYVVAHNVQIDMGNFQIGTTIKKVEVNKDVDPKIFDMPKS